MKKIFVILSLVMSLALFSSCGADTAAEKHDFRNVDFGMSTVELFEVEGNPDSELSLDSMVTYYYNNREVFGVSNADIAYFVDVDGVTGAYADYKNTYVDNKSYQTEYQTIKKNLIAELGNPVSVSENDEEFNYSCSWDAIVLEMYKKEDSTVKLWVHAHNLKSE